MESPKRVKKSVRFETLNTDDLPAVIEEIEPSKELEDELRQIANCYTALSKRQRGEAWEQHLRERESTVQIIDDRPLPAVETQTVPATVIVTNLEREIETWLQESPLDVLLNKPSFIYMDYQAARVHQTLRINIESYLNRELVDFDRVMQYYLFQRQDHNLRREDGTLLVYATKKVKLILYLQNRRLLHYWLVPIKS